MGLRIGIDGRVFIGDKTGVGHYVSDETGRKVFATILTSVGQRKNFRLERF